MRDIEREGDNESGPERENRCICVFEREPRERR